ncbi:MAG TPA: hypothetical protein PLS70_07590 [Acidobacteriota bacterium]|nr:hypothetical protein [Acidobacteriota bacterium]
MNHTRLVILVIGFSVFAILVGSQTPHEPIYRHLPTENEPIFPPQGPPAPPGPPLEWALEGDRQRERAGLVVEYHPEKGFSLVKPFRDPHDLVKEADLPKFLASKRIRRNLVIVTFGKITLFGKSKPERDQVFEQLAAQFRKLGFRKIIFQQEAGNGPYQIGERTF